MLIDTKLLSEYYNKINIHPVLFNIMHYYLIEVLPVSLCGYRYSYLLLVKIIWLIRFAL